MQTMRIKKPYYDAILKGKKTIEVRVGYDSIKRIKSGQLIRLSTHLVDEVIKVDSIEVFNTFEDLLDRYSYTTIAPHLSSRTECLELLREIYPKDKEHLGVYALKISVVR